MNAAAPRNHGLWVDGKELDAAGGSTFSRQSPFNGHTASVYANGTVADAQHALEVAHRVFDGGIWSRASARARYEVLVRAAAILREHQQDVLECMAAESGKPVRTGLGELTIAIHTIEYYAGCALDLEGSAITNRLDTAVGLVLKEPVGVAGFITPWNFPILNPVVKIAPALAVGCSCVVKPSHLCSGPVMLLARYLAEAGLPGGVLNVISSDLERGAIVGQHIAGSPLVDKIAFTGSTSTGRAVMATAAGAGTPVALELGGKSANIVFADADLQRAAKVAVTAFCNNSGQQCSAGTRLLVQRSVHAEFVELLSEACRQQVLGDPMSDETSMGPLVNDEQFKRVTGYLEIGRTEGRLIAGGGRPQGKDFEASLFVEPTLFDDVDNSARIAQEEIFGPVLSIIPFDSKEDAIRAANDSKFGLAGGVWTRSIDTALDVVRRVRTGKMFVNCYNNSGLEDLPHGGYKASGIGREQGRAGLEEFQSVKTVQILLDV